MSNNYLRTTFFCTLLIMLQVWVFTPISLWKIATPLVYPLILLLIPMNRKPLPLTLLGFLLGTIIDYLSFTPGLHASSFTLTSFIRHYLIKVHTNTQDNLDLLPLPRTLHSVAYLILGEILFIHYLIIHLLSISIFQDWVYLGKRFVSSYIISYLIAILLLATLTIRIRLGKNDQ